MCVFCVCLFVVCVDVVVVVVLMMLRAFDCVVVCLCLCVRFVVIYICVWTGWCSFIQGCRVTV